MDRNRWTACAGTAGRLPPELVDGFTGIGNQQPAGAELHTNPDLIEDGREVVRYRRGGDHVDIDAPAFPRCLCEPELDVGKHRSQVRQLTGLVSRPNSSEPLDSAVVGNAKHLDVVESAQRFQVLLPFLVVSSPLVILVIGLRRVYVEVPLSPLRASVGCSRWICGSGESASEVEPRQHRPNASPPR